MGFKKQRESGEDLKNKFLGLLKKFSEEDLQNILTILVCDPKFLFNNNYYEKLKSKEKEQYKNDWLKLNMFDLETYNRLFLKLKSDFDIFVEKQITEPILDLSEEENPFYIFPKVPLLIETIKEQINLIKTGQTIPEDQRVREIECFKSDTSEKDYKLIINGDYFNPLKISRIKKTWDRFIKLIEDGYLDESDENHDLYDYLNFNSNNLITTNTKYPLQPIIKQESNAYVPLFKASIHTEKALIQRQNKIKNST